jgi:ATP-dependent Lhr-like helicase
METLTAQNRLVSVSRAGDAAVSTGGPTRLWLAAERRCLFESVFAGARFEPPIPAVASAAPPLEREEALIQIVRGRLEALGPVTVSSLADSLGLTLAPIETALATLQAEGFAMRGRFTSADPAPAVRTEEWCERGLLARIHRYTVKGLRAEIEPVQTRDFLRFLFQWHKVDAEARMQGSDAVASVLAQLEGFEAPAGSWEAEILPARILEYDCAWLDEHCLAGRFVWTRLAPRDADPGRGAAPVRATPIALLSRRNVKFWSAFADGANPAHLTAKAQAVCECLRANGASFFDEIVDGAGLLPAQAEEALGELVALGVVNADSFGGLRALLAPADRRRRGRRLRRGQRSALFGMADAGRWALVRRVSPAERAEAVEHVVRTLLRRWGVVFWRLLLREADWLPPWREILMCCRRLEARGEIRGGRFVAGFSGEQYALPEAIGLLREVRRKEPAGETVSLSAADPLNLLGVLTPGPRLPALTGNRLLYRDGLPLAVLAGGEAKFLEVLDNKGQWEARNAMLRRWAPAALADLT